DHVERVRELVGEVVPEPVVETKAGELSLPGFWRSETGYAETFHVWTTSATRRAESMGVRGCWWWDSNPQGLSPGSRTRCRSRGKYFFGLLNARINFLRSGLFSPVRAAAR